MNLFFRYVTPIAMCFVAGSVACSTPLSDEHDVNAEESAEEASSALVETAQADMDSQGKVSVRAGTLTLTFDNSLRSMERDGEKRWVLTGRTSRNIADVMTFVPDDPFGEASTMSARTFEIALRDGHELNSVLAGMPLLLSINTTSGTTTHYEALLQFGARWINFDGSSKIRIGASIQPVFANVTDNPLRYRTRVDTSKTYASLQVISTTQSQLEVFQRSARRFDADWFYEQLAIDASNQAHRVEFRATDGPSQDIKKAQIEMRIMHLGLTTKNAYDVWPRECVEDVRLCVNKLQKSNATDFSVCGTYDAVRLCRTQFP